MNRHTHSNQWLLVITFSLLTVLYVGCKPQDEKVAALEKEKTLLEQRVTLQQSAIDSLRKVNATLLGGAANKVNELVDNNNNLESIIKNKQRFIDSLNNKLASTFGELRSTQETLQREKQETSKKDSINSRLERFLGQRESEASTLRQQNESLQNANREMNERMNRLTTQVSEIRQRTEGISTDLNQSRTNLSSFREEIGKRLNAIQERLDRPKNTKGQPTEVESKPQ